MWWYHSIAPEWMVSLQQLYLPSFRKAVLHWLFYCGLMTGALLVYTVWLKKYKPSMALRVSSNDSSST